jgi:hypothetical protein
LSLRADVYVDLATTLRARGDAEGEATAVRQAHALYELKGNKVAARRIGDAEALAAESA